MPNRKMPEEKRTLYNKIQFLNKRLVAEYKFNKERVEEYDDVPMFDSEIKEMSHDEIMSYVNGGNKETRDLINKSKEYNKYFKEISDVSERKNSELIIPENTGLDRIAPYALDYSYVRLEKGSDEYNQIIQKNKQIIEGLKSPENRKAFAESKMREMLKVDMKLLLTGTKAERFEYVRKNPVLLDFMTIPKDLEAYYRSLDGNKGQTIDHDLLNAFTEKTIMFEQAGGNALVARGLNSELCQFSINETPYNANAISGVIDLFSEYEPTSEERSYVKELKDVSLQLMVGLQTEQRREKDSAIYELLASKGIISSGDENVRYEALDKDGNNITLSKAIDLLVANENVSFKERSNEYVDHILKGTPAPENKYTGKLVGVNRIDAVSDLIENMAGVDIMTAVNNGYITAGKPNDPDNRGLIAPGNNTRETAEKVYEMVKNGEDVTLSIPNAKGEIVENKLSIKNGRFKSEEYVPANKLSAMKHVIEYTCQQINATGKGFNDSGRFNKFKDSLNNAIKNGVPAKKEDFDKLVKQIKDNAKDYMFAKLDQSQNQRRAIRFTESAKMIEMMDAIAEGRKPSMDNVHKNIIAAKAVKAMLTKIVDGKKGVERTKAEEILGDQDKFFKKVEELKNKPDFDAFLKRNPNFSLEDMSKGKAKDLGKAVNKECSKLELVSPVMAQ